MAGVLLSLASIAAAQESQERQRYSRRDWYRQPSAQSAAQPGTAGRYAAQRVQRREVDVAAQTTVYAQEQQSPFSASARRVLEPGRRSGSASSIGFVGQARTVSQREAEPLQPIEESGQSRIGAPNLLQSILQQRQRTEYRQPESQIDDTQGDQLPKIPPLDIDCKNLPLRDFDKITIDIADPPTKGNDETPPRCDLIAETFQPRHWSEFTFLWKASSLCHKPLYFEDFTLERYGHTWCPVAQPFVSGAHFFGSLAVLPYQMGMHPPQECMYPLGYYRPGSCAPKMIYQAPLSAKGAAYQTATVAGLIWLLP